MYKIIENRNELNEILKTMDKADTNQRIYSAGYTLVLSNINANGNEEEYKADMRYFVVSDDDEENIADGFFEMAIVSECVAGEYMGMEVDMVEKMIELYISETETKYLFGFWNSAPLSKEMVEWLAEDLAG